MKTYILPFRDAVVHPGIMMPVYLDNAAAIETLEIAAKETKSVILAPQKVWNYPTKIEDIYTTGTRADIVQVLRLPDGTVHAMVNTAAPVDISDIENKDGIFMGNSDDVLQKDDSGEHTNALRDRIAEQLKIIARSKRINMDKLKVVINAYSLAAFIDVVIQMTDVDLDTAIKILRMETFSEKLTALLEQVAMMVEMSKIDENINRRVTEQLESGRREAYLQEKMRALQSEMGEDVEDEMDSKSLRSKIEKSKMPSDAKQKAISELKRLRNVPPMSAEAAVIKTYLDELLSMPWGQSDKSNIDLNVARDTLNHDHSGMEFVKERILEHIAVMKKTGNTKGTILCLVGAPGVGKTSLGRSIADALGRKYQRISLGGISDEAHFRGHRKTYIGSQPGRIMDALKRAKVDNPVIVLDEIDKMGRDYRGDPESALLEVLDPEQNKAFRDHYLEVDFDLSNVMFIATANTLNISAALKDRMEIIEMPGYSESEKIDIARNHLIARAAKDTGWKVENIQMSDEAIKHLIHNYTAEQGVRQLQRELTAILRRSLLRNNGEDKPTDFTKEYIDDILALYKSAGMSKRIGFGVRA